jgi:hypothetical protein
MFCLLRFPSERVIVPDLCSQTAANILQYISRYDISNTPIITVKCRV